MLAGLPHHHHEEVNTGEDVFYTVWHEHKNCAAVDEGVTSNPSCLLHLKNELKNRV